MECDLPQRTTGRCAVCRNEVSDIFLVREMQIGLREVFEYGCCHKCGAMTRLSKINEISRYYPSNYYSFNQSQGQQAKNGIKSWLRNRRDYTVLTGGMDPIGQFLDWASRGTTSLYRLLGKCQIENSSHILDIGCGSGYLLHRMAEVGFQKLIGLDAFISEALLNRSENPRIIKGGLDRLKGLYFDLIMMNHSLEHCEDQYAQLKMARDLLAPKGVLLIRQPFSESEAFRRYNMNWFQLDAPRHAVVHSLNSMRILIAECGLKIQNIIWDSNDQQFWASEQYVNDIPMYDERSFFCSPERSRFTPQQIAMWKREAKRLNRSRLGDQAAWYIVHA